MNKAQPWALTFLALNIIDLVLTLHILAAGIGTEGNPVMAWVFRGGLVHAFLYKLIFPFSIISGYGQNHKAKPGEPAELLYQPQNQMSELVSKYLTVY